MWTRLPKRAICMPATPRPRWRRSRPARTRSSGARVGEDDLTASLGIENDLGLEKCVDVILEAPDLDCLRRHEAMAVRDIARRNAVEREGEVFGGGSAQAGLTLAIVGAREKEEKSREEGEHQACI